MGRLRILHISDPHLASIANVISRRKAVDHGQLAKALFQGGRFSSYNWDCFQSLISFVSQLKMDEIDLILLTGDLATSGDDADLAAAEALLLSKQGCGLGSLGWPIRVIPGNHDRIEGKTVNGMRFESYFKPPWDGGHGVVEIYTKNKGGVQVVLIGADFSLKRLGDADRRWGEWKRFGQGEIYPDVLRSLVVSTTAARKTYGDVVVFWVVHFPPEMYGDRRGLPKKLLGTPEHLRVWHGRRLIDSAGRHHVCGIL